jgi:hypothetical protein
MDDLNKFMNEINWLVSLFVAIPLSIAGNLLTPLFQNWRAQRSQGAARRRLEVVAKELEQATTFAADRAQLNTYLIVSLLIVIVLFSFPNVFGGFFAMLYLIPFPNEGAVARIVAAGTGLVTALLNLMAIMRATQAITVYHRVRDFSKYEAESKTLLSQLRSNAA